MRLSTLSLPPLKSITRHLKIKPVFTFLLFSFLSVNIWAQSWNVLISPANTSIELNQTFTVDVLFQPVSGTLSGVDAYVNFDPTYLQVTATPTVPPTTSADAADGLPNVQVSMSFNNTTGEINHGRFTLRPLADHPNINFVLYTITFQAIAIPPGPGTTSITFNTTGARITNAVEGLDPDVLDGITSGTVTITAPSGCTPISAASIGNTATCDAQDFNIILQSVTGGVSPYDVVVDGQTYNNITVGGTIKTVSFPIESIWPIGDDVPAIPNGNDNGTPPPPFYGGIEVGNRFFSSVNGFIKGIRLYNGFASPTGTYTGKLYANDGTLLASANFAAFSGIGWKQVLFSSPIPITAGTVYVTTYFSSVGNYALTPNYFQSSGHTTGSLTAIQSGINPGQNGNTNGLFAYEFGNAGFPGAPAFPERSFGGNGYFADVLFSPATSSHLFTSITGDDGCNLSGSQPLTVTSVDCSTLPVSLLNFSATPQGNKIALKWATASEENNRGFDIQRSIDGANWTTIGFVAGAGNSSFTKNYSYIDGNLAARRYYYKLKQIDFDEHFKYSAIVSATLNGKGGYSLGQNYPNPTKGETTIQFTLPKAEKVNLSLFDVSGRIVKVIVNGSKDEGTHAIPVNVGSLTRGIYYYRIQAGDFTDVKKLTIQ